MEEFEEGRLDTGLPIRLMVRRKKKSKGEEGFKEESLDSSAPTRGVAQTRKQSDETKAETLLKRKATRKNKEK